ncbi:sugar phosphate isomerase/epimerase family protein [Fusobacterium sp.]|uniref:sugar phosphate isomerase/epimerase family protein n=1 Tax=Fusobacterium sp. TaxID=68766 RepID=UPI00396CB96A
MKKNTIHISDLIFYKKSYDEIIKFLEENKIKNLELFIEPLEKEYTQKMMKVLENYSFDSISFHGPFRKCNLAVMTAKEWDDTLYSFEESFRLGQKYNPRYFVLHTNEWIPGNVINDQLKKKIAEKVAQVKKIADNYGAVLAVENVGIRKTMVFNQKEFESLILDNGYSCLIDIGHAFVNKWDIPALIEKLKKNIVGYHFHNNDGEQDWHRPIGDGRIDYDVVYSLARQYTPKAVVVLEYDFSHAPEKALEDCRDLESR